MSRRVAIAAAALLASCASADGFHITRNHCTSDADCSGRRCDVTISMCIGSPPAPLQVGLEIAVPPSGASVGSVWPVAPFTVTGPYRRDIAVPRPVAVAGTARQAGRVGPISADITFTPAVVIPGRGGTAVHASTTAMGTTIGPVATADYVAQLSGSTRYLVTIAPTGVDRATLPPLTVTTPVDVPVMPDSGVYEVNLSYPATFNTVVGDLVNAVGDPLPGLVVQAVDANGVIVSSTVTSAPSTDLRPGSFTLALSPGLDLNDYLIRVSTVSTGSTATPVPTFIVDPRYLYPTAGGRARVLVPDVQAVTYQAMVARADTGAPVVGATVELEADSIYDPATGVTGSYNPAPVATDETGMFTLLLVPGTYHVVIVPSGGSDSDLGVLVADPIMLDHATMDVRGMLFELPVRATYGGTVMTVDGHTMTGAAVAASSIGSAGAPAACSAAAYARTATTSSDPTGQFQMRVDCGTYDVVVQPPAGSGYAWTVHTGRSITGGAVPPDEFLLDAPVPVTGVITDATGAPVAGAEIRAFGVLGTLDTTQRSVGIGSVTTDAMGRYTLLLSPTL